MSDGLVLAVKISVGGSALEGPLLAHSGRHGAALRESAFGGKADILWNPSESPLLTLSRHSAGLLLAS